MRLRPPRLRAIWSVALVVGLSVAAIAVLRYNAPAEDWRAAAKYVESHSAPGEPVLFFPADGALPFRHYYTGASPLLGLPGDRSPGGGDTPNGVSVAGPTPIEARLRPWLRPGGTFWLVASGREDQPTGGPLEAYMRERLQILEEGPVRGPRIRRYSVPRTWDCVPPCAVGWSVAGEGPAGVSLAGVRGQIASAGLEVAWPAACADLTVRASDLRSRHGVIPAGSVRIREALPARYDQHDGVRFAPTWLVPTGRLDAPSRRMDLWTTVEIPLDAPAGEYQGRLDIRCSEVPPLVVSLRTTVSPFHLPRPRVGFAMLYTHEFAGLERFEPDVDPGRRLPVTDREALLERGRAMVADLAEHGMTAIFPHSARDIPFRAGEPVLPDLEESLRVAAAHGMTGTPGFFVGQAVNAQWADLERFDPRVDPARARRLAERALAIARDQGYGSLVFVPADEPNDPEGRKLAVARALLSGIGRLPGIRLGVTSGADRFGAPANLADLHEVSIFDAGAPPARWEEMRRRGHEVWLYANEAILGSDPALSRFIFGLWGWRTEADAVTAWTHPLYTYEPYYDGRRRVDAEGHPVPERDAEGRPIGTLVWESVREGTVDRRYVQALEDALVVARGQRTDREAQKAATLLAGLRASVPSEYARARAWLAGRPGGPDAWLTGVREELAAATERLTLGGPR